MLALLLAALIASPSGAPIGEVPNTRLAKLSKGINLSHWWAQAGSYDLPKIERQMTREDFQQIAENGFRHVRLTLEPRAIWNQESPVRLDESKLKSLKDDLREIREEKLAAVIDIHPSDELKTPLEKDKERQDAFVAFWTTLATELQATDPEWVFLEVLNEPVVESVDWLPLQGKLVQAIRKVLPRHTVIVSGGKWSGVEELLKMKPYEDRNLVYNFHSYDPFAFTHQGATWGWEATRHFKDLPYPSSPSAVSRVLPRIDETARGFVKDYGDQRWDYQKLDALFRKCADWGRRFKVPVTCNEFGAYKPAPRDSRLRYLKDARTALEANGIGWTMWDYAGGFGAYTGSPGERSADREVLAALGLR